VPTTKLIQYVGCFYRQSNAEAYYVKPPECYRLIYATALKETPSARGEGEKLQKE
jgi:hypothetical protein